MPLLKEISKCRRIPKEKLHLSSGDSIDDEDTEIDEDFVKMRKLFKQYKDQKFIKKLKKKMKENLLNRQNGESSEPPSDNERPKVDYPEPLPKTEKKKKAGMFDLNSFKKLNLGAKSGAKNKEILKKAEDLINDGSTDKSNYNPASSSDPKSSPQNKNDKKDDKPTNFDKKDNSENKKSDKPNKEHKRFSHRLPFSRNDRDLTKNEVEAMIRQVLRLSREEGGGGEDIEDVSLGETESYHSGEELEVGEDPQLSTTPEEISSDTMSEDENAQDYVF